MKILEPAPPEELVLLCNKWPQAKGLAKPPLWEVLQLLNAAMATD